MQGHVARGLALRVDVVDHAGNRIVNGDARGRCAVGMLHSSFHSHPPLAVTRNIGLFLARDYIAVGQSLRMAGNLGARVRRAGHGALHSRSAWSKAWPAAPKTH